MAATGGIAFLSRFLARDADVPHRGGPGIRERPELAKEELLTMEGQIDEVLPDGRFRVMLDNQHQVIAYTAGKMRKFRIRTVAGDRVHVEMTPYDLTKGRIVFRERGEGQGPMRRQRGFRR